LDGEIPVATIFAFADFEILGVKLVGVNAENESATLLTLAFVVIVLGMVVITRITLRPKSVSFKALRQGVRSAVSLAFLLWAWFPSVRKTRLGWRPPRALWAAGLSFPSQK